jgi:hypothetical protein
MSSRSLASTYIQRVGEIEKLVEIARKLERIAVSLPSFEEDPAFQQLEVEYRQRLRDVLSLSQ